MTSHGSAYVVSLGARRLTLLKRMDTSNNRDNISDITILVLVLVLVLVESNNDMTLVMIMINIKH